jgi:hypothetical protein
VQEGIKVRNLQQPAVLVMSTSTLQGAGRQQKCGMRMQQQGHNTAVKVTGTANACDNLKEDMTIWMAQAQG